MTFQKRENEIAAVYQPVRKLLKASCDLSVADILSAREGKNVGLKIFIHSNINQLWKVSKYFA